MKRNAFSVAPVVLGGDGTSRRGRAFRTVRSGVAQFISDGDGQQE